MIRVFLILENVSRFRPDELLNLEAGSRTRNAHHILIELLKLGTCGVVVINGSFKRLPKLSVVVFVTLEMTTKIFYTLHNVFSCFLNLKGAQTLKNRLKVCQK